MTTPNTDDSSQRPFALVTGASSGIGLELARQFADNGFDVLITAEDDELDKAAADLRATGATVIAERADLAEPTGVEQLFQAAKSTGRPIAAAALNAGVGAGGRFVEMDLDADLRVVALNVASTVHLAKLLVRDMGTRGEGRLLFTSSIAATVPGPYYATYGASKAFIQSFAQAIRYELKDSGVTVTSLMPGPTDTEFFERADMTDTAADSGKKDDPADVARDGFEALMAGKDQVVAGSVKNKAQTAAGKALPDTVTAGMTAKLTKPGSGDS
ncbi:MAG: SDR family NAD(P)-dependent oxidoreductase [Nocardioidaceae bacterium]|nr:SDR family NAD(P)-dependent oxidoreductase [Nocardioidaceae bacterium]